MSAAAPHAETAPAASHEQRLRELGLSFRRLFRTINRMRGREAHLPGADLSHAQFALLSELEERGPSPAGELAQAAQLSPATVTQMLAQLAASGHVERTRRDSDRRVVVSALTAQGRARIAAKRDAWQGRWRAALAGLSDEQLEAATCVLERLATMLDEASAAAER